MALIAIVPAKANSSRVPYKNYREFYKGKSLVGLTIDKLKAAGVEEIYLSCEEPAWGRAEAEFNDVEFVQRSEDLCSNDCPIVRYIPGVAQEVLWHRKTVESSGSLFQSIFVEEDHDILWAQVIDPLFDDYAGLIDTWYSRSEGYDSAVVVYPRKKYLLDSERSPIGFGFGPWHLKSQRLPYHYELPFTASILSREAITSTGYYVGADPLWYEAEGYSIDIDTEEDFEMARAIYEAKMSQKATSCD